MRGTPKCRVSPDYTTVLPGRGRLCRRCQPVAGIFVCPAGIFSSWSPQYYLHTIAGAGDPRLRAAGIVLAALSTQQLWGHVFFNLVAYPLLCIEATAIVGSILEVVRAGTVWENNVITGPSGYGIVVYDQCSVFHNLSLAMLCWITLSKLRHPGWRIRDFGVGIVIGVTMISWNIVWLCLMAWDIDLYHDWHDGSGAQIFALGASLSIPGISVYGSKPVGRPT